MDAENGEGVMDWTRVALIRAVAATMTPDNDDYEYTLDILCLFALTEALGMEYGGFVSA